MPTPVSSRDNGHTAKTYGNPLGIECESCKRRALVQLDRLGNLDGNMRPLKELVVQVLGLRIARGRAVAIRKAD